MIHLQADSETNESPAKLTVGNCRSLLTLRTGKGGNFRSRLLISEFNSLLLAV